MVGATPDSSELVARHYRPPEVILKGRITSKVDVWSAAVCLIELATGARAFPGNDNEHMLQKFLEMGITFHPEWVSSTTLGLSYFSWSGEKESIVGTGRFYLDRHRPPQKHILKGVISRYIDDFESSKSKGDFCDLVTSMLTADPDKRPSAAAVLGHAFFRGH